MRRLSLALAALMLTACQPSMFRIFAENRGGETVLVVTDRERDSALGAGAQTVTVRGDDAVLWRIERINGCVVQGKSHPFPLTYGREPECFRTIVDPQPLDPGALHLVTSSGPRDGDGYFVPGPPAQNFERDEVIERIEGWRDLSGVRLGSAQR